MVRTYIRKGFNVLFHINYADHNNNVRFSFVERTDFRFLSETICVQTSARWAVYESHVDLVADVTPWIVRFCRKNNTQVVKDLRLQIPYRLAYHVCITLLRNILTTCMAKDIIERYTFFFVHKLCSTMSIYRTTRFIENV